MINSEFNDQHFVQIYGTAMGPKNSCSCADITMAVVDEVITTQGPFKPEHWDDCFDIWTQGQDTLITFTDFLNTIGQTLGCKTKLKFEVKFDERKLDFLDTSLHLVDGRLEVDVFSNPRTRTFTCYPPQTIHLISPLTFHVESVSDSKEFVLKVTV